MPSTKLVVGLTGGIGSGKSTVAELFRKKGVTIIDTDQLARDVIEPHTDAYNALIKKCGETILNPNGHINRKILRELVFNNTELKNWLERLLHPLIRQAMEKQILAATSDYCIAVIPLLFETKPNPLIQRILVVDIPEALQISRASTRDNTSHEKIQSIMKTQITREKRIAGADDIIKNDKKLSDLIPEVEKLHALYLTLA